MANLKNEGMMAGGKAGGAKGASTGKSVGGKVGAAAGMAFGLPPGVGKKVGEMAGGQIGKNIGTLVGGIKGRKAGEDAERAQRIAVNDPEQLKDLRQSQQNYKSLQAGTSGITRQKVAQQQKMVKNVSAAAGKSQGGLAAMLSSMKQGQSGINEAYNQAQGQAVRVGEGITATISEMGAKRDLHARTKAAQALADFKQKVSNDTQTAGAMQATGANEGGGGVQDLMRGIKNKGALKQNGDTSFVDNMDSEIIDDSGAPKIDALSGEGGEMASKLSGIAGMIGG